MVVIYPDIFGFPGNFSETVSRGLKNQEKVAKEIGREFRQRHLGTKSGIFPNENIRILGINGQAKLEVATITQTKHENPGMILPKSPVDGDAGNVAQRGEQLWPLKLPRWAILGYPPSLDKPQRSEVLGVEP